MPTLARILALLALALAPLCAAQAPKPQRLALVIGNGAYKEAPLPNPVNDAADIARALEESGFTVIRRENASLKEMHLALREFGDRLTRSSTGLFYFAGHGLQVRGRNYLVPVDADIAREDEVAFQALDLAAVIEKLDSARNPVNLLVLDACRNNPFGGRLQVSSKGLAQVDAPPGTLIAFATAPGSVAADGDGRNGMYTRHLLREMRRSGAGIEEVFKGVRAAVRRESDGRQVPWESTSLETAFFFHAAPVRVAAAVPAPAPSPASSPKASAPRAMPTSLGAPPNFVKGDRWTYRIHDVIAGSAREVTAVIQEIQGDVITYGNGTTADLFGNPIRTRSGEMVSVHEPSSQFYVFPLKAGAEWKNLTFVQVTDAKTYDATTTIKVVGEEEIVVPAGRMKALRVERSAVWTNRKNAKETGTNAWTYWYSSAAKRWVLAEHTNTTAAGKLLRHEKWELLAYSVQ